MRELSVVITVMNEEDNIQPLVEAINKALAGIDYEVIFVDDGSTDETRKRIKELVNTRTVLVELRKNYGQSTAMTAGIDFTTGKYIALLDGDLQNDPMDIPMMLALMKKEDWDVVAGNRKELKDDLVLRKRNALTVTPGFRYGFSNKRFNPNIAVGYRFGKKYLRLHSILFITRGSAGIWRALALMPDSLWAIWKGLMLIK